MTKIASYAVIFLPVGIFYGAAYEIGLFQALGMQSPWRLFSLFPVSPAELLRTTLGAGLLFSLISCILAFFWLAGKFLGVRAAELVGNGHAKLIPNNLQKAPTLLHQRIVRLKCKSSVHRAAVDGFAVLTLVLIVVFVVFPVIELVVMKFFQNSFMFGAIVLVFLIFTTIGLMLSAFSWYQGIPAAISKFNFEYTSFAYALGVALFAFIVLFEQGRIEAIEVLKSKSSGMDTAVLQNFDQKCGLGRILPLVRSYSVGGIILSDQKLVWIPFDLEKGMCMSVNIDRPTVELKLITPTLFGIRINALKFEYEKLKRTER